MTIRFALKPREVWLLRQQAWVIALLGIALSLLFWLSAAVLDLVAESTGTNSARRRHGRRFVIEKEAAPEVVEGGFYLMPR